MNLYEVKMGEEVIEIFLNKIQQLIEWIVVKNFKITYVFLL